MLQDLTDESVHSIGKVKQSCPKRTAAGWSDNHDAVADHVRLVQLDALVQPWRVRLQAPLLRHLTDHTTFVACCVQMGRFMLQH